MGKWITKSTVHTFQILQQLDDEYNHQENKNRKLPGENPGNEVGPR